MSAIYRTAERLPGLEKSQHAIGGAMQRAARVVRALLAKVWRKRPT